MEKAKRYIYFLLNLGNVNINYCLPVMFQAERNMAGKVCRNLPSQKRGLRAKVLESGSKLMRLSNIIFMTINRTKFFGAD